MGEKKTHWRKDNGKEANDSTRNLSYERERS